MANKFKQFRIIFLFLINYALMQELPAQTSGSLWIMTFAPGSANISDATIDKATLTYIDSLMKRNDIEVTFLGGADPTNWQLFGKKVKHQVSDTWDQAKKLERASILRQRYNKGQIGTTDEPVRGVKVVWEPKRPDLFKLKEQIEYAHDRIDSLNALLNALNQPRETMAVIQEPSTRSDEPEQLVNNYPLLNSTLTPDWEIKTGFMVWSAGGPYDLSVPYMGIALKRLDWAFELQGGFMPWSEYRSTSKRGNALLMGSFHLFPREWLHIKTGVFSGWEFLTESDVWTMKFMGLTIGPKFNWHFFETYLGYTYGKLSSLTDEYWCSGALITTNFRLKLN
jgi:hypothetical protein